MRPAFIKQLGRGTALAVAMALLGDTQLVGTGAARRLHRRLGLVEGT